ncbi:MAG: arginyltransferase [Pacificibacter sp.]|uniref:arginyltransferase n=1 Tax=Pacificibacter sp. TaxID=1917866 RepID=UPI00321A2141
MRHSPPPAPQFYVTTPQACPYLDNKMERKLFTALQGELATELSDSLSKQGFRRSQNVLYRPTCVDCSACMSARIRVKDFVPSKSQKRAIKKNNYLKRSATSPWATEAQYELFRNYLDARHADGGMADMDVFEFAAMIEETPIRTRLVEYYAAADDDDDDPELSATCLTDVLDDGLSMVYSFYKPELTKDSLGTYIILDHIEIAREAGLPYVYLGYWVPGSPKMGYKARFSALEVYKNDAWVNVDNPDTFEEPQAPDENEPIAQQLTNIRLPRGSMADTGNSGPVTEV